MKQLIEPRTRERERVNREGKRVCERKDKKGNELVKRERKYEVKRKRDRGRACEIDHRLT